MSAAQPPLVQLTSIESVAVKTVWPTEAHHFTPWLLYNGKLLSSVLGLDVELDAREYKAGKFSLDVIGREVGTGSPVIIATQPSHTRPVKKANVTRPNQSSAAAAPRRSVCTPREASSASGASAG